MNVFVLSCLLFGSFYNNIGVNGHVGFAWPTGETVPMFGAGFNVHAHFLKWGFAQTGVDLWLSPPIFYGGWPQHAQIGLAATESYSATVGANVPMGPLAFKLGPGISYHRFEIYTDNNDDYSESYWGFHMLASVWLRIFWKLSLTMSQKYSWLDITDVDTKRNTYSFTFGVAIN